MNRLAPLVGDICNTVLAIELKEKKEIHVLQYCSTVRFIKLIHKNFLLSTVSGSQRVNTCLSKHFHLNKQFSILTISKQFYSNMKDML